MTKDFNAAEQQVDWACVSKYRAVWAVLVLCETLKEEKAIFNCLK